MPVNQDVIRLVGSPVGISLRNGEGADGVLCDVQRNVLYVLEYMYQDQFAMKQYPFHMVQDVHPFPPCGRRPQPGPPPRPRPGRGPILY